jgi:hypothetical protein
MYLLRETVAAYKDHNPAAPNLQDTQHGLRGGGLQVLGAQLLDAGAAQVHVVAGAELLEAAIVGTAAHLRVAEGVAMLGDG